MKLKVGALALATIQSLSLFGAVASAQDTYRFATFNASMNRSAAGALASELSTTTSTQARSVAEIVQKANPDVLLINEFDVDLSGASAQNFQNNYLGVSQNGAAPINFGHVYVADSNTGVVTGFDLNNDGTTSSAADVGSFSYANDSQGFGQFPGQFGFAIFSKHKIEVGEVRSFQNFLWKDMPGNLLTNDPTENKLTDFYSADEVNALRLSSKNHVDVPITINGETVHVLAAHPTPPVFDGDEDRNGKRNHDEIRLWADYVSGEDYMVDDDGQQGGLGENKRFVIMGDYNADPFDGDSYEGAINLLLDNAEILGSATDPNISPAGPGGTEQASAQGGANADHLGDPQFDTADFGFNFNDPSNDNPPGNLRVDYVLPSAAGLEYVDGGVFWPLSSDPDFALTSFPTSDHRLVYADVQLKPIPVPGALVLLGSALALLALKRRAG